MKETLDFESIGAATEGPEIPISVLEQEENFIEKMKELGLKVARGLALMTALSGVMPSQLNAAENRSNTKMNAEQSVETNKRFTINNGQVEFAHKNGNVVGFRFEAHLFGVTQGELRKTFLNEEWLDIISQKPNIAMTQKSLDTDLRTLYLWKQAHEELKNTEGTDSQEVLFLEKSINNTIERMSHKYGPVFNDITL